ncbi:MAG: inorganic phosphate transporter [Dehalococcoidia bacterium]|nr:inorganic phosphate transporter [Dehalococcoidia bacterium]
MPESALFIFVIIFAIGFALVNGFNDAANAIATVIGTRVLSPLRAVGMAAVLNFAGAATGTAVAVFIGTKIIDPGVLSQGYDIIFASLAAVIIWGAAATFLGLPVSISHSFIAGLVGAGFAAEGSGVIMWGGFGKVLSAVGIAPLLGFAGGLTVMVGLSWAFRRATPLRVEGLFSRLQILSAAFMAYSHGKNDGQMPIGVIAMALMIHRGSEQFQIDPWMWVLSGSAIALGTLIGGWRVIRTLGTRITALRPVHGFAAESSAAAVIEAASALGIPVSTTHCISSSIMGVGATKRLSAVRWGVAGNIILAWVLTFPICAGIGWLLISFGEFF